MRLIDYENYIKSESKALHYLLKFCWKNHQRFCPRCRQRKNYALSDGRRRCAQCSYTFHDFSGRWINNCDLSCRQWLRVIKLFELDLTILAMSRELGMVYNTAYKAVTTIRCAIAASAIDARDFFGPDSSIALKTTGRMIGPQAKSSSSWPVFGVMEQSGLAFVDLVPNMHPETVFHFHSSFGLQMGRLGKTFFTDAYQRYHALLFCSNHPSPRFVDFTLAPQASGLAVKHGFLSYLLERLRRFRGLSPEKFPLYVKELEFRYNNRHADMFMLVAEALCGFVPKFA
jgi:transposase